MLTELFWISGQRPLCPSCPGLAAPGQAFAPLLKVARWRLGGRTRGLFLPVQAQHQLDQFLLAQALEIVAAYLKSESARFPSSEGGDSRLAPRLNRAFAIKLINY